MALISERRNMAPQTWLSEHATHLRIPAEASLPHSAMGQTSNVQILFNSSSTSYLGLGRVDEAGCTQKESIKPFHLMLAPQSLSRVRQPPQVGD